MYLLCFFFHLTVFLSFFFVIFTHSSLLSTMNTVKKMEKSKMRSLVIFIRNCLVENMRRFVTVEIVIQKR